MTKVSDLLASPDVALEKLTKKSGIPIDRLRQLAAGDEPSLAELRGVSQALKIPITDFAKGNETARQADLLFRQAPVAGGNVSNYSITSLSSRMASSFDLLLGGSEAEVPWWVSKFDPWDSTHESVEHHAETFRDIFCDGDQLSPLLSLPRIVAERMNTMLFVVRSSELDGASAFFDGVPFAFVSARFPGRMLFTLAHEVGHLVAHHDPTQSFAIIDESTGSERGGQKNEEEKYADAFASALLMPPTSFGMALKKVRELAKITDDQVGDLEINYLARIFGVSFWAAARRCEDLGVLPRGGAASLNEDLTKKFGSPEKRAEEAGLPPRPEIDFPVVPRALLSSAVERIRAGEMSVGKAASVLGLSIADLMTSNAAAAH